MSELPTGWAIGTIQSLYDVNPGHRGIEIGDETEVSFIPMTSIEEKSGRLHANLVKKYRDLKGGYTKFIEGDVVFAKITPCMENGKIAIANNLKSGIGCGTTELHVFRPLVNGSAQYLLYFLLQDSVREEARRCFQGTSGHLRVPASFFDNLKLPIPPLNEQRRIVAKLEELLGKVDACKKRLEKIPAIIKRFRQSVLAAACSGRLTADWRDTNEKDCSMNWTSTKLGNLTSMVTSGSRGWAKYYSQNGAIFVRAQNINADYLDLSDIAYVNLPDRAEGLRTKVRKNDLLVTITGANVTKSAIVHEELDDAYVSQHVALVRLKETKLSLFLFYWLLSPAHGRAQLLESAYGQGKPELNLDNIRNVDVSVPTDPERCEITRRVEALFRVADQIEARYDKARAHVDRLTQSILAKAFRGELVPQDPNDEPASILLERIRAERSAAPQPSSQPRRTKASSHIKRSGRKKSVKRETAS